MAGFWQWDGDATLGAGYIVLPKGAPITVMTATITATLTGDTTYTSSETNISGFNSVLVLTTAGTGGGTATVIAGAFSSGGTMASVIDKDTSAQMTTGLLTSSRIQKFNGLPDYLGFTTTLSAGITSGSSVSVAVLPLNL